MDVKQMNLSGTEGLWMYMRSTGVLSGTVQGLLVYLHERFSDA